MAEGVMRCIKVVLDDSVHDVLIEQKLDRFRSRDANVGVPSESMHGGRPEFEAPAELRERIAESSDCMISTKVR